MKDWGPLQVHLAHERWVALAEKIAHMNHWPLKTPKGDYAPRVTKEVVATLFGFGRYTPAQIEAWYRGDEDVGEPSSHDSGGEDD